MANEKFVVGPNTKCHLNKYHYTDHELKYAMKGFVLDFFHVPSGKTVQFKALITKFDDKYESSWNSEMVYGRSDPIQNFQGTKRTIDLSWDVVAASWGEAKDNLQRASLLNSMLYPSYINTYKSEGNTVSSISAAPIFKLGFANLIRNYAAVVGKESAPTKEGFNKQNEDKVQGCSSPSQKIGGGSAKVSGLVGSIAGFTYSPDIEAGFFDPKEEPGMFYPQTIKLSCTFTVMHTHPLGWNKTEFRNPKFPYGQDVKELKGLESKSVMQSSKRNSGTDNHKKAKSRTVTGGK